MSTIFIYNEDTSEILAKVSGEQKAIESYADENFADTPYTYTPAQSAKDGLFETSKTQEIEV